VREREAVWRRPGPQEPGTQDLVEGRLGGVWLEPGGGLQRAHIVLEPEDRGCRDQLVRLVAHARTQRGVRAAGLELDRRLMSALEISPA
jgi:hypothetical protein